MGKRSDFKPRPQDKYFTPEAGVLPLLQFLEPNTWFIEPCAGDGRLIRHLEKYGHSCRWASDIEPENESIKQVNALELVKPVMIACAEVIITNPPWSRPILHELIQYLPSLRPTWLLFDADWMHTRQASQLIKTCAKIVSIGRLKWIEDSPYVGKDNSCWYFFPGGGYDGGPTFFGRT